MRRAIARACSPPRTPARCSSTRSASCRCRSRPSSCASSSRRSSAGSATTQDRRVDVRIITATNRDLDQLVARGSFRQDLYYRINVFPMHLPPLRERPEDIALLVHHFVQKYRARLGKPIDGVTPGALARLAAYEFPGNVRELENKIHQAMVVAAGPHDRGGRRRAAARGAARRRRASTSTRPFREVKQETIDAFERGYLTELLRVHHGNLAQAARAAGMDRKNLWALVAAPRPRSRALQEAVTAFRGTQGAMRPRCSRSATRAAQLDEVLAILAAEQDRSPDRRPRAAAVAPSRVLEDAARATRSHGAGIEYIGTARRRQSVTTSRSTSCPRAAAREVSRAPREAAAGRRRRRRARRAAIAPRCSATRRDVADVPSLACSRRRSRRRCGADHGSAEPSAADRRARRADRGRRRSACTTCGATAPESISLASERSSGIMPASRPDWIAVGSVWRSPLRMMFATAGVTGTSSTRGARPPSRRGSRNCVTTVRRHAASCVADLALLRVGERVDHAIDRADRVRRVQRREHEVAGLGGGQRGGDRLAIAQLAEQDHVGCLAQRGAQAGRERRHVRAELALVDQAAARARTGTRSDPRA